MRKQDVKKVLYKSPSWIEREQEKLDNYGVSDPISERIRKQLEIEKASRKQPAKIRESLKRLERLERVSRIIDGQKFYKVGFYKKKSSAKNIANFFRQTGDLARVIPVKNGYNVYHRKGRQS